MATFTPPRVGSDVADEVPEVGFAKLTVADDPKLSLLCELGDAAPVVTQGYGGWEEVARGGRTALTSWRGHQPMGIDLSLYLDDYGSGTGGVDIGAAKAVLEAMAGRGEDRQKGGDEPPHLVVDTAGVMPHDFHESKTNRWVVTALDWDEESALINAYGNWTRVGVVVSLLQFVSDSGLAAQTAAVRARIHSKAKPAKKRYTVKSGDTLVSIARTKLGDPGRWGEIARLNGLRDGRAKLKTGRHLRLP